MKLCSSGNHYNTAPYCCAVVVPLHYGTTKTILYDLKNSGWVVLLERSQFVPQKLGMKLLEMENDMKIRHSISSPLHPHPTPTKYGETFFVKKLGMGEQTFRGKFMGGWGLMIRS